MAGGAGSRDLVRAYGGFDIAAGEFSVYSELQVKNGAIAGYLKPLFRGIEVGNDGPGAAEKGLRRRLYEGMVGVAAKIFEKPPARRGRNGGPDLWSSESSTDQPLGGGRQVAAECVLQGDPPGVRAAAQPDGRVGSHQGAHWLRSSHASGRLHADDRGAVMREAPPACPASGACPDPAR